MRVGVEGVEWKGVSGLVDCGRKGGRSRGWELEVWNEGV